MISIIVAFEREATRQKICTLLERSGHPVRAVFEREPKPFEPFENRRHRHLWL